MSTSVYQAKGVIVLNLTHTPDRQGHVIPPECHVMMAKEVPIFYSGDHDAPIGWAKLRKEANCIVADMRMKSTMKNASEALELMRNLYPAVGFAVEDSYENLFTMITIGYVTVSSQPNVDQTIGKMGNSIHCLTRKLLN